MTYLDFIVDPPFNSLISLLILFSVFGLYKLANDYFKISLIEFFSLSLIFFYYFSILFIISKPYIFFDLKILLYCFFIFPIFFFYKKINFNFLNNFNFLYLFFLFIILLVLINSMITPLDADSFKYHLSYPFNALKNNSFLINKYWFHAHLIGTGEFINLFGLIFRVDNFVSILNFVFLLIILKFFISKEIQKSKLKIILVCLLLISPTCIYSMISTQKFQFISAIIIAFCIINASFNDNKFSNKHIFVLHLIFYFACASKYFYYLFIPFLSVIFLIRYYEGEKNLTIKNLFFISFLSFLIVFFPIFYIKYLYLGNPISPIFTNIDNTLLSFWYLDQSNFDRFNIKALLSLFFPVSLKVLTSSLGVGLFLIFLNYGKVYNYKKIILIYIFLLIHLIFFQFNGRSFFSAYLVFIYLFINSKYIQLINNRNIFVFLPQAIISLFIFIYSIFLYYPSIIDNQKRNEVLSKYGFEYSAFNEINKNIKNNSKTILLMTSNIFFNEKFISFEPFVSYESKKPAGKNEINKIFMTELPDYIIYSKNSTMHLNNTFACYIDKEIHTTKNIKISSRNPFNNKYDQYIIYKLKKDFNC